MLTRPRLRTKTGCLTCRRRRKKCCERRPRCRDCTRHGLDCVWPEATDSSVSTPASVSSSAAAATATGTSPAAASPSSSVASIRCSTVAHQLRRHSHSHSHSHAQSRHCSWPRPSVSVFELAEPALVEANLLHHFVVGFMPLLVRAEAHPGFRDVSFLYVATGSRPWMRSLFASLAALHLGQGTPSHQAVADRYYYTALAAYKVILEKGEAQGTEDWLLSAAVFFYLYEQWRSGVASNIRQHLEGTAQLLRLRRTNRRAVRQQAIASTPVSTLSAMDRIAAESFLYHVAIDSIVDPDLDTLSSKFSWADVNEGLGYNPFPSASEAANSPVLGHGGAPSVYRLAFEVTRLGRHWPLVLYDRLEAVQLHKTLSELKTVTLIDDDPEAASPTVRLYLLAIEIYLLKLLDGSEDSDSNIHGGVFVTSSDLYVQHLAQAAMSIIRDEFCTHNEDDYGCLASSTDLCWPMVVLVCTIEAEVDIQLLKECLIALWRTSYCGYVRRIALVVERVWTWRTWPWMGTWTEPWMEPWVGSWQLPGMENECIRDGLCLLTQQGGLARFLNVV